MTAPPSNVVGLPVVAMSVPPGEAVPSVVEALEIMLDDAKRGEIVQLLAATVDRGGGVATSWQGVASPRRGGLCEGAG